MHTKFNIEVSGFQNKEMKNFRVGFSRQMLNASATCSSKGFRYPKNKVGMYNLHLIDLDIMYQGNPPFFVNFVYLLYFQKHLVDAWIAKDF